MSPLHPLLWQAVLGILVLEWLAFAAAFLLRRQPAAATERRRDRRSSVGIAVQGLAFAIVWCVRRPSWTPIVPVGYAGEIALAVLTIALSAGSVSWALAAARALGKQWAFAARVIEGHALVTTGPYAHCRNPIYAAMLGMLLATGLALTPWQVLIPATAIFGAGTFIRIRSEEKLLRAEFGDDFDAYRKRVRAVIPHLL